MSESYREYLELFEYFGRGGMTRMGRQTFETLEAEFNKLIEAPRPLSRESIARVAELKGLLFRDRPKISDLAAGR